MSEILNELQEVKKSSQEQTAASQAIVNEVSGKMAEIDRKVDQATTEVRDTIIGYNYATYYVNPETGDNNNDGLHSSKAWRDLTPLQAVLVYGKTHKVNLASGKVVDMLATISMDNGNIQFESNYSNPATLKMACIDYQGIGDGTVSFKGKNLAVSFFGVHLETATQPSNNTGKSTAYNSSVFDRSHGGFNVNLEMYMGKIIVKDFPLIRSAHHNAGFVALNLGYSSGIVIGEGNEQYLTYSDDHFGLSNGIASSIDNKNGANTWNAIMSGVGGNSNVLADFDFEAQA